MVMRQAAIAPFLTLNLRARALDLMSVEEQPSRNLINP
jgi:hypothetical protein